MKKVIIVGAGPSGLLLAHYLLNRLLNEYTDDLNLVLEQFTKRRLADAHAIVELSNHTLPFKQSLFVQLIIRQRVAKLLHRLFPQRFFPPLFEALHESSIPYAEILKQYRNWCNKVKKSKPKFFSIS